MLLHPCANGLRPHIAHGQMAKLLDRKVRQPVGLAIAAGVDIAQHIQGQLVHRDFGNLRGLGHVVVNLHGRDILQLQGTWLRPQAQAALPRTGAKLNVPLRRIRADQKMLMGDLLVLGAGSVDVKEKIGTGRLHGVIQIDLQLKSDHGESGCVRCPPLLLIAAHTALHRDSKVWLQALHKSVSGWPLRKRLRAALLDPLDR